jgi:Uncharacterized protein conserved in bacteria
MRRKGFLINILLIVSIAIVAFSCGLARDMIDRNMPKEDTAANTNDVITSILKAEGEDRAEDSIAMAQDTTQKVEVLSKKEINKLKKEREKQDKISSGDTLSWFKKNKELYFPTKIDRDSSYPLMYKEKPKSILILYPYNRSKIVQASQMFVMNIAKEFALRGYYVVSPLTTFELYKQDTMACAKKTQPSEVKKYKQDYGVDAVLFVTIYTLRKNWWSTNINSVAEYCLISTQSGDTLFYRKADFNYDTPIPPYKEKKTQDGSFKMDQKSLMYFGTCYQMQHSVFMDFPFGPYHKEYMLDRKKFSYRKIMKYKLDMRPS